MQVTPVFPTPMFVGEISSVAIMTEVRDGLSKVTFEPTPSAWGKTHKVSHIDPNERLFNEDAIRLLDLKLLEKELGMMISVFCAQTGVQYREFNRTSWFSLFEEGDYGHIHHHSPADISGCVYVETNGSDGSICFSSPNPAMSNSRVFGHMATSFTVAPHEGRVLLFPSFLEHGIQTNQTKHRRVSLAFNITFK